MNAGLYVFALSSQRARPFSAAGHRIEFVDADGVYAAVERLDARPRVSEEALRTQHTIVAEVAKKVDAILPARFGSFVDRVELARLVQLRRGAIVDALDLVRGRVQMTVRVFDAGTGQAETARAAPSTGTAYLEDRRRAASGRAHPRLVAVADAVKGIVVATRSAGEQGRVAVTLYHLVDSSAVGEYRQALTGVAIPGDATVSVTGPWPPFAFAPDLWP